MNDAILARILRESEGRPLLEVLADQLSPTDFQSLMLEVYRRRAARVTPSQLLSSYEQNPYVRPATIDSNTASELNHLVCEFFHKSAFDMLELSPVCPLGTCSGVATVDQNKTLSTVRNTEVVSDPTNVLALECAVRRRALLKNPTSGTQRVRLSTMHRVVRPQRFEGAASFAHFRLLGMCTAGRDEGSFRFEQETLQEQLALLLLFLNMLRSWLTVGNIRTTITDLSEGIREAALQEGVITPLRQQFGEDAIAFDPERASGRGYYTSACFAVYASDLEGNEYMLADGGFTDWTQKLLSNRKERLLIGGLGIERLAAVFPRLA